MANPFKTSGIYQIRHIASGKRYIGSSSNISVRWNNHRSRLKANTHHCSYLQNAWNKYGEDAFVFEVLENCLREPVLMCAREQYWLDKHLGKLYNARAFAEQSSAEFWRTEKGLKQAGEHGKFVSEWWTHRDDKEYVCVQCGKPFKSRDIKGRIMYCSPSCRTMARKQSGVDHETRVCDYCKEKYSAHKYSKQTLCSNFCSKRLSTGLTPSDVVSILTRFASGEPSKDIARTYGIKTGTVWRMAKRKSWSDIPIPDDIASRIAIRLSPDLVVGDKKIRRNGKAKLTIDQVKDVKRRLALREPMNKIAADYGVSNCAIHAIKTGKSYKYVEPDEGTDAA